MVLGGPPWPWQEEEALAAAAAEAEAALPSKSVATLVTRPGLRESSSRDVVVPERASKASANDTGASSSDEESAPQNRFPASR